MKSILIENDGEGQKAYNSLVMEPKDLGMFVNELARKIVRELARRPGCAMDLARKLRVDEQKVYYHLRKLEGAGVVRLMGTEMRYGMTAKIYRAVSPVVSVKLYDGGESFEEGPQARDPDVVRFLRPFIKDGKLNAKIIMGSPYPHGKYEGSARDGVHVTDLAIFLGCFLDAPEHGNYRIDTEVRPGDLKENLILIGGPKVNTIVEKINRDLPLYFDEKSDFAIVSRLTGERYTYGNSAVILKAENPFNRRKKLLLLAGKRSSAMRVAVVAFIEHIDEIMMGNSKDRNVIAKVVRGIDRDGDGIIDSVKIME